MKQLFLIIFSIFISQNIFSQLPQEIEKNIFLKVIKNKFGLSDNSNKVIVPFIYDFIEYKNQKLIVRKQNSQGLLSIDNKILVPIKYQFVLPRNNNRFILWTHSSLFGLCDTSGKIIIPVKFKIISPLEIDNLYLTENDKQLNGVYDLNGNVVLKESYKFYTVDNNKIFATEKKIPVILDLQNIDNPIYLDTTISFVETQRHYSTGEMFFQIVKQKNKFGVINAKNETIIPIIYDEIKSSQHWKYFLIKENSKIGIINIYGEVIKKPIYDNIELRKEYVLLKRKNQKDEFYSYQY